MKAAKRFGLFDSLEFWLPFFYFQRGENMEDGTLDISGAAAVLKLSPWTIYKLVERDKIPFHKPGGRKLVFFKSELEEFIRNKNSRK